MNNKENQTQKKFNRIAQQIHPSMPSALPNKQKELKSLENFRQAWLQIHNKRQTVQNSYEKVISALQEVVEQLFQKNDCLVQERQSLVKDNCDLRRKNESLTSIIEVKKRLGESVIVDNSQIFQVLVQTSSSCSRAHEESYECGNTIGNILQQNSNIANRHEFIIQSNPLSQNVSQVQENEISMSNIGRTQNVNQTNLQTPGLNKENIYIQTSSKTSDGIIRAFYLSAMQKKQTAKHLMEVIESLKHDITTVLFEPYPTNQFWIDMLCTFLKTAHDGHFDTQLEVLEYIKVHKLIDTLIIKCLKSRIEFLFYNIDSFEVPTTAEILGGLANEFCLRMEICEDQYFFFTKEVKDQNLLSSNDRASLQISLNNKDSNVYYVREEEPCFSIMEREDYLQFSFFIIVECELGISQYEINENYLEKEQSFRCNESNNESLKIGDNQFQLNFGVGEHLEGVVSVLNQRDMNYFEEEEKKLTRNFGHRRYNQTQTQGTPKTGKQPLNSSRFFMNRVASKNSSFDENA